jgi:hypothetical protein
MLQINSYPHPQAVSKVRIIDSPSGLSAVAGPEQKTLLKNIRSWAKAKTDDHYY